MAEQLYRVNVKGGGSFLYDTIDVGRWALRMAEVGDTRPFTVKPWSRRERLLDWLSEARLSHFSAGRKVGGPDAS